MQSAEEFLRALDPVERGRVISVLRSSRGLTRDELANDAKASPNTISDWERGKIKHPRDLFTKLDPVLAFTVPKIRHALTLIRAPRGADEIAEGPADLYDSTAADEKSVPADVRAMTSPEIERELAQLHAQIGRVNSRVQLLNLELAVRQGVLRLMD